MDTYDAIAGLYQHVPLYAERPDVAFYVDEARRAGSPVLEIGCGTGRVLLPTARAGLEIAGLDASPAMLEICRRDLAREPEEVRRRVSLVHSDMRGFDLGRRFRLITLPFRPFQHLLTVADQLRCLDAIRRHLAPGGRLVLDVFNPSLEGLLQPVGVESAPEAEFALPDGRRVVRRFRIAGRDHAAQVNRVELIYEVSHPEGRTERLVQVFGMRYFFRYELEHLLCRAGFSLEALYAGFDRTPFGSAYPGELVVIAAPGPGPR